MENNFIENEEYSFEGVVVNTRTDKIHEWFGLTDERNKELREKVVEALKDNVASHKLKLSDLSNSAKVISCLSDLKVNTLGEFTFCICIVNKAAQTLQMIGL